jgi:hypothetical protein
MGMQAIGFYTSRKERLLLRLCRLMCGKASPCRPCLSLEATPPRTPQAQGAAFRQNLLSTPGRAETLPHIRRQGRKSREWITIARRNKEFTGGLGAPASCLQVANARCAFRAYGVLDLQLQKYQTLKGKKAGDPRNRLPLASTCSHL